MAVGQLVAAVVLLLTAGMFLFVGVNLRRFPTSPEAASAMRSFGTYWAALGASALLEFALLLASATDALGGARLAESVTGRFLFLISHGMALAGIAAFMAYIAFIFTGRSLVARLVFTVYAIYGAAQLAATATGREASEAGPFSHPFYATEGGGILPYEISYLLALAPLVLGTLGLLFLGLRTGRARTQYRAVLVGGALLMWALSSATGFTLTLRGLQELTPQLVALAAAVLVYAAYYPPDAVRLRLEAADEGRRATAPPR